MTPKLKSIGARTNPNSSKPSQPTTLKPNPNHPYVPSERVKNLSPLPRRQPPTPPSLEDSVHNVIVNQLTPFILRV
ncbi:hypothetical protein SprV_0200663600 [Sparganum proliferum]